MAIKVFANSGGAVTYNAEELCAPLYTFAGGVDYIFKGIADEMAVTYSSSSTTVTVKPGKAIVCGRPVTIDANTTYDIGTSKSGYKLVLRVDKSRQIGQEAYITAVSAANVKNENINGTGTIHDLVLGTVTTNTRGVSSYVDNRSIKSKSGGLEYDVVGTL